MMLSELDVPQRLLLGPGPANAHPRVLRAMSTPLLGQFDPEFTAFMNETMGAYRQVFETDNTWTLLIDGSARAAIEAAFVSVLRPGERVLVIDIGRFGGLLREIAERCGAEVHTSAVPWGEVAPLAAVEAAARSVRPQLIACVHGDTSTTMMQPLEGIGALCRELGALLYVDATATLGGVPVPVERWQADIVTAGLQKCMGGPPGMAPLTLSARAAEHIMQRRSIEHGLRATTDQGHAERIRSNYFDLAMIMEYWSDKRLNHHTEATSMLYAARECARVVLQEGLSERFARHARIGAALLAGIEAMTLKVYGDRRYKMPHVTGVEVPEGIDAERIRARLREDFGIEIGAAFGPLRNRLWRIGTMGWNCTKPNVLTALAALEAALRAEGFHAPAGAAVDAAMATLSA